MLSKIKSVIEEYQCPGCTNSHNISCYQKQRNSSACSKHSAGTMLSVLGSIFLGMPKGFNRVGNHKDLKIDIYENFESGEGYNFLNIPVWKFKDEHGNTLVRGLRPRINDTFIHIYLEDCRKDIDC